MNKQVDTVKVIKDFPGFEEGTILQRYHDDSFILINLDEDDNMYMDTDMSWRLSEDEVLSYLGTYFEDVTTYEMRTREEVEEAISRVKESINNEQNDPEAILVWKNLLYCLEWVIGRREYQIPNRNENLSKANKR